MQNMLSVVNTFGIELRFPRKSFLPLFFAHFATLEKNFEVTNRPRFVRGESFFDREETNA